MNKSTRERSNIRRLAITVRGLVQGVGFRPFVYNAARDRLLSGWVFNEVDAVCIEVQGEAAEVASFCDLLKNGAPPQARVESIEFVEKPADVDDAIRGFRICRSTGRASPGPTMPSDLATCDRCLDEIRTPGERRYRYPFTNCTNCGPRWSIVQGLPYDRPRTSMARFSMCPECRGEYETPTDRRFHAQPIACPRCGPSLRLLDARGNPISQRDDALRAAAAAVLGGQIVAMKGLGGFQLIADATNSQAVSLLRERKCRPNKPFAVMVPSLEEVRRRCEIVDGEAEVLESCQAPILLVRRRSDRGAVNDIAHGVAPGNPYLGMMLPYTPLHHLLMAEVRRPIVCTSGNLSEEPMAICTEDAIERLGPVADLHLVHDRPIVRPVDDSVARIGPTGLQLMRRARGYAPLPIHLSNASQVPTVLALGGHLKNTISLKLGTQVVITPHIGDLDTARSIEVHRRAIEDLVSFYRVVPDLLACDLHPDYASTRQAQRLATEWDVPLVRIQHHHAHVSACMAEHGLEGPLTGLAWDGTGYGPDGTVWGGEILECEGDQFRRLAHLRTFPLLGGDQAVRQPRRSALGVLSEILGPDAAQYAEPWFSETEFDSLLKVLSLPRFSPRTSSMGRLFDAVAALCGLPLAISFEGQAAMALEFAADWDEEAAYPVDLYDEDPAVADWQSMVRAILEDRARGVPTGTISARFHNALAELAVEAARIAGHSSVVMTGGCFQNLLLTCRVRERLLQAGFAVYTHQQVPCGDGGISLGQVNIAARRMKESYHVSGDPG